MHLTWISAWKWLQFLRLGRESMCLLFFIVPINLPIPVHFLFLLVQFLQPFVYFLILCPNLLIGVCFCWYSQHQRQFWWCSLKAFVFLSFCYSFYDFLVELNELIFLLKNCRNSLYFLSCFYRHFSLKYLGVVFKNLNEFLFNPEIAFFHEIYGLVYKMISNFNSFSRKWWFSTFYEGLRHCYFYQCCYREPYIISDSSNFYNF